MYTRTEAVPRSIPMSLLNKLNIAFHLIYFIPGPVLPDWSLVISLLFFIITARAAVFNYYFAVFLSVYARAVFHFFLPRLSGGRGSFFCSIAQGLAGQC